MTRQSPCPRKDSLANRLDDPQKSLLSCKYPLANTAVTPGGSIAANLQMVGLENLLTALEKSVPVQNEVKAMAAKFADTDHLLDAANAGVLANDHAKAET